MSGADFLTRLAQRALGSAPTLRPLVRPLYAEPTTAPESATLEERSAERPARVLPTPEAHEDEARLTELRPDRHPTSFRSLEDRDDASRRRRALEPTDREVEDPASGKRPPGVRAPTRPLGAPRQPGALAPEVVEEGLSIVRPRSTARVEPTTPAASHAPGPESKTAAVPLTPPTSPLRPLAVRRRDLSEPARPKGEPAEPTIRVTIGRVEVRAVTQPDAPQPPARPQPEQTLAEYLREAAGRRRR